jgi:hypothetical protein
MSRHFLYKVDEKSLRLKLNSGSELLNEEAWQKFEQFLSCQKQQPAPKPWLSLNLNINRAYILPGVFATMILLFSLLLYNFMSIRIPDKTALKKKQSVLSPKVLQTAVLQPNRNTVKTKLDTKKVLKESSLTPSIVQIENERPPEKEQKIDSETNRIGTTLAASKRKKDPIKTTQVKKDTLAAAEMLPDIQPVYDNNESEAPPLEAIPD